MKGKLVITARLGSGDWRTGVAEWLRRVNLLSVRALPKWAKRRHLGPRAQAILSVLMGGGLVEWRSIAVRSKDLEDLSRDERTSAVCGVHYRKRSKQFSTHKKSEQMR